MKKILLTALLASAALAPVAFAQSMTPAPATTTTTTTTTMTPAKSAMKTTQSELKDGTKIEITGNAVEVVGKDGKKSPAPDGTWELKDGTKLTTKGGKVAK